VCQVDRKSKGKKTDERKEEEEIKGRQEKEKDVNAGRGWRR